MEKLWDEVKEKCLVNASKCVDEGNIKEAERLLKMALWVPDTREVNTKVEGCLDLNKIDETVKKQEEHMQELQELARPMVEFLRSHYHPYTTVSVSYDRIKLDETTLWIPQNDYAD